MFSLSWEVLETVGKGGLGAFGAMLFHQLLYSLGKKFGSASSSQSAARAAVHTTTKVMRDSEATEEKTQSNNSAVPAEDDKKDLAELLASCRSAQEWEAIRLGLEGLGQPISQETRARLNELQEEAIKGALDPDTGVTRLAAIAEKALHDVGITTEEVGQWRESIARLPDDLEEAATPTPFAPSSSVVSWNRPTTWWIWDKREADRRLLRFIRRTIKSSIIGCDHAIQTLDETQSLRDVHILRDRLALMNELVESTPSLLGLSRHDRIDARHTKELVRAAGQAVDAVESLAKSMRELFAATPASPGWTTAYREALMALSPLDQLIKERRGS